MRLPGSPILGPEVWGLIARMAGSVGGEGPSVNDELIKESNVGCEGKLGNEGEPSRPIGEMGPELGDTLGCCMSVEPFPFTPIERPPTLAPFPLLRLR
jgi:hypothetical protein